MRKHAQHTAVRTGIKGLSLAAAVALLCAQWSPAATLHGRVKDQQCSVLARVHISIQALSAQEQAPRVLTTNDSGDYTVELAPGAYRLCLQRDGNTASCQEIDILSGGDTWITTQLRNAAPDLSNIGNRAY